MRKTRVATYPMLRRATPIRTRAELGAVLKFDAKDTTII